MNEIFCLVFFLVFQLYNFILSIWSAILLFFYDPPKIELVFSCRAAFYTRFYRQNFNLFWETPCN